MASVQKRIWTTKEGVKKEAWLVRYFDEKGIRRGKTCPLKKEAETFKRKVEREIESGTHTVDSDAKTVREIADEFVRESEFRAKRGEIGDTRVDRIKDMAVHYNAQLANVRFRDITARQVDDLYGYMVHRLGHLPFSAHVVLSNFATMERFAVRRGYLKTTPVADALKGIRRPPRPKIRIFDSEQVAHLLRVCVQRERYQNIRQAAWIAIFIHLAAFCGMRIGEIIALDWNSVDFEAGEIRIRRNMTKLRKLKGPKSRAGNRDVPMPAHVAEMLLRWRERGYTENDEGLVFTTNNNRSIAPCHVFQVWTRILKRADLFDPANRFHFHALRHFAGSWWIDNGMKISDVTAQLGHADPSTTLSIYTHSLTKKDDRREAMQAMASRLVMIPATHETHAAI